MLYGSCHDTGVHRFCEVTKVSPLTVTGKEDITLDIWCSVLNVSFENSGGEFAIADNGDLLLLQELAQVGRGQQAPLLVT